MHTDAKAGTKEQILTHKLVTQVRWLGVANKREIHAHVTALSELTQCRESCANDHKEVLSLLLSLLALLVQKKFKSTDT